MLSHPGTAKKNIVTIETITQTPFPLCFISLFFCWQQKTALGNMCLAMCCNDRNYWFLYVFTSRKALQSSRTHGYYMSATYWIRLSFSLQGGTWKTCFCLIESQVEWDLSKLWNSSSSRRAFRLDSWQKWYQEYISYCTMSCNADH